ALRRPIANPRAALPNIFRNMIGLPPVNWQEANRKHDKLVQTDNANIPPSKSHFLIICRQLNDLFLYYES
ncbi:MAG: hypothetical protein ACJ71G_07845, partial [Nitrososphaeraceae archaeon]